VSGTTPALDASDHGSAILSSPCGLERRTEGAEVPKAHRDYLDTLYEQVKVYYDEGMSDFEIKPEVLPAFTAWQEWAGFDDELGKHVVLSYLEIEAAEF